MCLAVTQLNIEYVIVVMTEDFSLAELPNVRVKKTVPLQLALYNQLILKLFNNAISIAWYVFCQIWCK
jgi:hypothetical protein